MTESPELKALLDEMGLVCICGGDVMAGHDESCPFRFRAQAGEVMQGAMAADKLLVQMATAMYGVHRRLEFCTKREVTSPSNHQEFAREAEEELDAFNLALTAYNEWAVTKKTADQASRQPDADYGRFQSQLAVRLVNLIIETDDDRIKGPVTLDKWQPILGLAVILKSEMQRADQASRQPEVKK